MKTANATVTTRAEVVEIHPIDRRDWHTLQRQRQQAEDRKAMRELKQESNRLLKEANAMKKEQLQLLKQQNEMLAALIAAITTERNQK